MLHLPSSEGAAGLGQPDPFPRAPGTERGGEGFSSSSTRKAIVHCQVTAASQQDTAVPHGVPKDSPNSPPGAQVGLMGLFHPTFLGRAAGCKPSTSLGTRRATRGWRDWGQGPPQPNLSLTLSPLTFRQQQIAGNELCLSAS